MTVSGLASMVLSFVAFVASTSPLASAQEPLWSDELVSKQPPARNAVPAKDDPALPSDNGSDHPIQGELRALARISDDQTYQDSGDPVVPTIGMVSHRVTDLFIAGRGLDFSFERRYSSHDSATDGPLGFGWDHCYNARMSFVAAGAQVTIHNGNGREDVYVLATSNPPVYDSPPGVYTLLKAEPTGLVLRNREGTRSYFSVGGRLLRIEDPEGNALQFQYDTNGRLEHVIDTLGRQIEFGYDVAGRLQWIQDFRGRRVEYSYDVSGNLTGVRSPIVASTAGFNDFPVGRVERYTYRPEGTGVLAHKLASVVRPNDVTQPSPPYGTPAVRFAYDTNPNSVFFGWCTSQILGGTNAAGTAGGTLTYAYTVLDYTTLLEAPGALRVGRLKTRVVNRKGFVTDYTTNQNGHVIKVVDYSGLTPFTTTNEYNSDGELTKITQPNGNYTTIAYESGIRHVAGNATTITHHSNGIPSDQPTRTQVFHYEPFFGNLASACDFRGNFTTYYTDYQEGLSEEDEPYDVIPALQAELLDLYPRAFVESLALELLRGHDLNGDGQQALAHGNLVKIDRPLAFISPLGGAPLAVREFNSLAQEAALTRTYNPYGQITSETDEEENVTVYLYYSELNPDGTSVPLPPGGGLDPSTGGYLRRRVRDTSLPYPDPQLAGVEVRFQSGDLGRDSNTNPTPANITTDYRYDPSGNLVSLTDGRGVRYQYSVNELDEVWRYRRATDVLAATGRAGGMGGASEDLSGQVFDYEELWRFDANGNVVAHFTENAGGTPDAVAVAGAPVGTWEEYWTFDILDNERTSTREYGFQGETATWTSGYDANENVVAETFPEGNGVLYTWDFRDQLSSATRGSGLEASQTTYQRDANGNVLVATDGRGKSTLYEYDGYDRTKRVVQPAGTEERRTFDAESNVVAHSIWGHPGGPSPSGNDTSLNLEQARASSTYDGRNRLIQVDREDPGSPLVDGALTPGDGKVTSVFNYDRLNRLVYAIDDDETHTEQLYDGASRPIQETDPLGNVVERLFDDNDNLVKLVERDLYPNGATRSFETYTVFDALDRVASVTDEIGRTERLGYDSRGFVVARSDAVAGLSGQSINGRPVNHPGNTSSVQVDGLGRVVREESDLRVGGTGDGAIDSPPHNVDGRSTRTFAYDRNSNLRFATDDRGETTEYQYDTLDRLTTILYADGTQFSQSHDPNGNVIAWQDAVGSQVSSTFDDKNRLVAVDAVVPGSVVGTTQQRYEYDGLDRLTESVDGVDSVLGNANDWVNEYTWDALGRNKTQRQNNRVVVSAWREEAKRTSLGYPSGVSVQVAYDALERPTTITQGVQLASFSYAGKDRLLERSDYGQVAQRYHDGSWNDSAYYDGARRPTKLDFKKGGALLTGIEHGFDRASNRLYTRRLHDGSKGDNFVYDSMYRLVTLERNVPASAVGTPGGSSFESRHGWELDGAHSRRKTTRQVSGSQVAVPTVVTVDDVHNYVTKKRGIGPQFTTWNQTFDLNGNKTAFTDQGTHPTYKYDFRNRLRVIEQGSQRVEFEYDAEDRRVRTKVTGLGGYPATSEYVHDGEHVIEEYDGAGVCLRRFTYGDELDELVSFENLAYFPAPGRYFYEQDSTGNVVAIHDEGGTVVERYSYGAYGSTFFETPLSAPKATSKSDFGNPYTFKGLRFEEYFDPLCYVRARFLDCQDGSFLQRDPIGVWGDMHNLGNPKAFCGSNPANRNDPLGLKQRTPAKTEPAPELTKEALKRRERAQRSKDKKARIEEKRKKDKEARETRDKEAKKASGQPPKDKKHVKVHMKDGKYYNYTKEGDKEYYDPNSGEDRRDGKPFEAELHGPSYCGPSCQ